MSATEATTVPDPSSENTPYNTPIRLCDIVMKGGATSGIVYPLAACEIARVFQFKNIGGTSAGAIAAALTAAAELGRRSTTGGFGRLAKLPDWLGTGTNMFDLFQSQPKTKRVYEVLTAGFRSQKRSMLAILWRAILNFPLWTLGGSVLGLILLASTMWYARGFPLVWGVLSGLVLMCAGGLLGSMIGVGRSASTTIPANFFGLCSGFGPPRVDGVPPLTTWLADELDRLAGKPAGSPQPLTFGDLYQGPQHGDSTEEPYINLEMMTTNLTHGRPYVLPFDTRVWFFHPQEFRELFPERIVEWLEDHPPSEPDSPGDATRWKLQCKLFSPLRPLPEAANLPVIVATRMSLSFPLLLSALPLWTVDWSRTHNVEASEAWRAWIEANRDRVDAILTDPEEWARVSKPDSKPVPARCWFSDGGITSNFPVHFFDAPVPRWPTFAINLRPFHPDHPRQQDERFNSWMADTNSGGIDEWWTPLDVSPGLGALTGFIRSIADTMQNWVDNSQLRVPGYRDRVVHVSLESDEGGLNLNMPRSKIEALTERGRCAGEKLRDRFGALPPAGTVLTWDNHRWVRYRTTMELIQDALSKFSRAYAQPRQAGQRSYADLVQGSDPTSAHGYRWMSVAQSQFAQNATEGLINLSREWEANGQSFEDGAPRPRPELRIRPRLKG